jgi:hypothetical protein
MFTVLTPLSLDMDPSKFKTKNNTDVLKVSVNLVPHNVLLVPNPLNIVNTVFKEESTLQNVTAQMVNTLMLITNVKTVMSNVKLVALMTSVSIVLKTLTDLPQKPVPVKLVSMKPTLLSVQLVTIIVLNVKPTQVVPFVVPTDLVSQTVYVTTTGMMMLVSVKNVPTNVMDVQFLKTTVTSVLVKIELMPQLVTVVKDISKMVSVKLVQNVLADVTLVLPMVKIV